MRTLVYSRQALKTLQRIPADTSRLIRRKMLQHAEDPASLANNVVALTGYKGVFRLRVGEWRVLFTEDGEVIAIFKIAPRGSAYE